MLDKCLTTELLSQTLWNYFIFLYGCFLCVYICIARVPGTNKELKRISDPWNWNYRDL